MAPDGRELAVAELESTRFTSEAAAAYSSDAARPGLVELRVPLELRREAADPAKLVAGLAVLATLTALLLPGGERMPGGLGVLVLPVTLAAAVLLVRERTPLATRLQSRGPRDLLIVATAALWLVVLARLLAMGVALPPW